MPGFHSIERHPTALTIPGLVLFRFNAPIVFFNAPYFKCELLAAANAAGPGLKWIVLDLLPITLVDATGLHTAQEVAEELDRRGVTLAAAGRQTEWHLWAEARRLKEYRKTRIFPTLKTAVKAYLGREGDVASVIYDSDSN